ncbi:DsbA family protein [Geomonas sp. Red875]|uniref:DsbA family protein n=1 Tax=Geomesophilobacter sediminis TaxID=2798584 RepID=A0A8J7S9G2_9BACT|nr:DsbA family protein [Geomesophilobacter sediminis]
MQKEYGVQFQWTVFPLHPDIPEEGVEIRDFFGGKGYDLDAMQARLVTVAEQEGLPLGSRTRISNGTRAQEVGKFAEQSGRFLEYQKAMYHAYFVEGKNIARVEELLAVAEKVGLPVDETRRVLEEGRFRAAVNRDWDRSRDLGITGVPAFVYRGRMMVGFQHYADFVRFIEKW